MAELMFISHAAVSAFLARMTDPEPILAAYSMAFYMSGTLGSPVWALQLVALSFIRDQASIHRLVGFSFQVTLSITWIWMVISLTPVGDWLFTALFGASPQVAEAARWCMLASFLVLPLSVARSLSYGLMMFNRRTLLVTAGTAVRLALLFGVLALAGGAPEHAVVGVLAMVTCVFGEATYAVLAARRFYRELPPKAYKVPGYRELWRFSVPIMLMQTAESGVAFTTNFFLGRLAQPELAIAAFGVLDSLVRVLLSPLRNLTQTCQALIRSPGDARVLVGFGVQVALLFAASMLVLLIPAAPSLVLQDIMGLPADMAAYVAPALPLCALMALCMAGATLCRGLLIARRRTGALAVASVMRIVAVVIVGSGALWAGGANGAIIGLTALTATFACEMLVLGSRLIWSRRSPSTSSE